jgi:hypothetical protein
MSNGTPLVKTLITPAGIGSYVSVLEPKADPQGKLKYSLALLIPKSRTKELDPLRAAIQEVAKAKWGPKAAGILQTTKYPALRDGDLKMVETEEGPKVDPVYKGHFYMSLRTDRKPQVIDAAKQPVFTDEDVYSGCLMRCQVAVFPYEQSGNRGIGLGLNNVQVLKKMARLDGRLPAEQVFTEWVDPDVDPTS